MHRVSKGILVPPKDIRIRSTGYSELPIDVNGFPAINWYLV